MKLILIFLALVLQIENALSSELVNSTSSTMNGFAIKDFLGFEKDWRLITTRYRTDTKEMRFTYANKLAEKALVEGLTDFPDGSIFAKIGYLSGEDPLFPSSLVPNGVRRFQFMVRDKQKFKETSGWGYALFDSAGLPFPTDQKVATTACATCHNIAAARGYVFSQLIKTSPSENWDPPQAKIQTSAQEFYFETKNVNVLPKIVIAKAGFDKSTISVLNFKKKMSSFAGTLDEIMPLLITEAVKTRGIAAFLDSENRNFSFAEFNSGFSECKKNETTVVVGKIINYLQANSHFAKKSICHEN